MPSLLRVKLTTCSFPPPPPSPPPPPPPPCFMIDRSNHSAVELPGDSCKLFANCDRFRGVDWDTRHNREKLRRISRPSHTPPVMIIHQSSRLQISSRVKRGDKLEINVRFRKGILYKGRNFRFIPKYL